ncbi:hypothetical protein BV898_14698 [Hypsibius exemplaris]|uniref:G-protein coupled receptors family 1 profile domain-containing protein n=1 Tax=Hypsibius exemplaris TaxID=2072580 RepID=A0A9X6NB28_HYPEX|nr:hypothetical protein BV898_14698 [Hypsibius exemplaris]
MNNLTGRFNTSLNTSIATTILPQFSRLSIRLWFGFSIACCIFGTTFLLILLSASTKRQQLRNGSHILLNHLMLMQLAICSVIFPIALIVSYLMLLQRSPYLNCPAFMLVYTTLFFSENWANVLIAVNRFVVIIIPHYYAKWATKPVLYGMIVVPWICGLGFSIPVYRGIGASFTAAPDPVLGFCYPRSNGGPFIVVWFTFLNYVPITLTGFLYIAIFLKLAVTKQSIRGRINPQFIVGDVRAAVPRAKNIAIARMLVVSFFFNFITLVPGPIITAFFPLFAMKGLVQMWVAKTLVLCGYVVSPVIFLTMSADYQKAVCKLARRLCRGAVSVQAPSNVISLPKSEPD